MRTFCEIYSKYILPALRRIIANILIQDYSLSQVEAARKLGVSQPAISYYISSKRGYKLFTILENDEEIVEMCRRVAEQIIKGNRDTVARYFCGLCFTVRIKQEMLGEILESLKLSNMQIFFPDEFYMSRK